MITTTVPSTTSLSAANKVQLILKFTFGLVPIVAGLDKFTNLLTTWTKYIAPPIAGALPFSPGAFMMIVGVIEIIAGILVLTKTELGAFIVSAWLTLIAVTLLIGGEYIDVAVRDLVMAISAYCLALLSRTRTAD